MRASFFVSATAALLSVCATFDAQAQATAAIGAIAGTVGVQAALDKLTGAANDVIDHGRDTADYLLVRAGAQALTAIDAFKQAYSEELNETVQALNGLAAQQFARIELDLQKVSADAKQAESVARELSDTALEIGNKFDPQSKRSFITRYSPDVIVPGRPGPYLLQVRGVALDTTNATLDAGPNDRGISARVLGHNELVFSVPAKLFPVSSTSASVLDWKIHYTTVKAGWMGKLFGSQEPAQSDVLLLVTPSVLGSYSLTTTIQSVDRKFQSRSLNLEQFKGVNANDVRAVQATAGGWKIQNGSQSFVQGEGGGNSYCSGFPQELYSDFAVSFQAHVGRIQKGWNSAAPGYVNCAIAWNEYLDVPTDKPGPAVDRAPLSWDEEAIPLPPALKSFSLTISTYENGNKPRSFTAAGYDDLYEIRVEPTRLVITPKAPTSIIKN